MPLLFPSERPTTPTPRPQRRRSTPRLPRHSQQLREPDPFGIRCCVEALVAAPTEEHREAAVVAWLAINWREWERAEIAAGRVAEIPEPICVASMAARHRLNGCDNCCRRLDLVTVDGFHLCAECATLRATEGPLSCELGVGADLDDDPTTPEPCP